MAVVPSTAVIGAPQLYAVLLFLQVESLLQPKLERVSTARDGSVRDMPDVLFYKPNRLRVFTARNQKIALHLHDFLIA